MPSHMCPVEVINPMQGLPSVTLLGGPFGNGHGFICWLCATKLDARREHWTDFSVRLSAQLSPDLVSSWRCGSRNMPSEGHLLSDADLTGCSEGQLKRLRLYFMCRCAAAGESTEEAA